jgi:hypothetical protein
MKETTTLMITLLSSFHYRHLQETQQLEEVMMELVPARVTQVEQVPQEEVVRLVVEEVAREVQVQEVEEVEGEAEGIMVPTAKMRREVVLKM